MMSSDSNISPVVINHVLLRTGLPPAQMLRRAPCQPSASDNWLSSWTWTLEAVNSFYNVGISQLGSVRPSDNLFPMWARRGKSVEPEWDERRKSHKTSFCFFGTWFYNWCEILPSWLTAKFGSALRSLSVSCLLSQVVFWGGNQNTFLSAGQNCFQVRTSTTRTRAWKHSWNHPCRKCRQIASSCLPFAFAVAFFSRRLPRNKPPSSGNPPRFVEN